MQCATYAEPHPSAAAKRAADFFDGGAILCRSRAGDLCSTRTAVSSNARPIDEPRNPLLTLLLGFGPTLLLIGGFLWLSRKADWADGRRYFWHR